MKKKRAVSDEPIHIDAKFPGLTKKFFDDLHLQFISRHYPYKVLKQFKTRDIAVCSTLTLSGVRASELSLLKKKQFINLKDRILLLNVKTLKNGLPRPKIVFPKRGVLKEFTLSVAGWLENVPEDDSYVFAHGSSFGVSWGRSITRSRILSIVALKTGKFPHYLRGVHETYYGEIIFGGNAWKLKKHMGLKRLDSTAPYVQVDLEADAEENLFK